MSDAAMTRSGAQSATVTAADIARLARVGRAAVSNWRRRFPDFPEPVGGSASSPVFSLAEVEAWFARHGRALHVSLGDRTWQQVQATVDDLRLGELMAVVGAFLVFLADEPGRWPVLAAEPDPVLAARLPLAITEATSGLPAPVEPAVEADRAARDRPGHPAARVGLDPEWVGLLRAVADLAAERGPAQAFDFLCGRYLEAHSRRLSATPPPVAEFMVGLLDVVDQPAARGGVPNGRTVLDPACGTGNLLRAAHDAGATRLVGQDVRAAAATLAGARLVLAGARARIVVGDSLRADALVDELADAVVCDPPFGERSWGYDELTSDPRWEYGLPPRGEPELAWVQHCLARVRPGGHVVVAMPAAAANRRPGRRIRANLLRAGVLRAVIGLPAGGPAATPAPHLWVLRRPGSDADTRAPSHVLLVDAPADLSEVRAAWRSFTADPERQPAGRAASVRIIDLLDDEVDISPGRHVAPAEPQSVVDYEAARSRLVTAVAGLAEALPDLAAAAGRRDVATTTVAELARAGVITIHVAPLRMTTDSGELPVLTVKDAWLGRAPSGRTTPQVGLVTVEPNDVVVPLVVGEPRVRVLTTGGAVLGPQILCFRADPERIDPHLLAGFLRAARGSGSRTHAGSLRADVRKTTLPLLPTDEQREYGAVFRRLAELEDRLRDVASVGADLVRLGFAGLARGHLRFRGRGGPG